jgi:hypothetical protein
MQFVSEYSRLVLTDIMRKGGRTFNSSYQHCAYPCGLNVIDIAPSSINPSLRGLFVTAVLGEKRVAKYLGPPKDPAYHLEIPQPEKS